VSFVEQSDVSRFINNNGGSLRTLYAGRLFPA
jgi:predicted Zn-dependent protease